jgi:hypothetical protein
MLNDENVHLINDAFKGTPALVVTFSPLLRTLINVHFSNDQFAHVVSIARKVLVLKISKYTFVNEK